jgi:hypothetical protein
MHTVFSSRAAAYQIRARLAGWISQVVLLSLAASALLIAARRIAGGFGRSPSAAELIGAAAFAAVLAAAARLASSKRNQARVALQPAAWLPTAIVIVFLAAMSLPGAPRAALVAAWCIVAIEEICIWSWLCIRGSSRNRIESTAGHSIAESGLVESLVASDPPLAVSRVEHLSPLLPPDNHVAGEIIQQSTRSRCGDGTDRLAGWLQISLATGERNATAHVGFCPPFSAVPKISLRQMSGPAGRVRAVQILPHGVRLELKLDHSPRHAECVSVEFVAETRS